MHNPNPVNYLSLNRAYKMTSCSVENYSPCDNCTTFNNVRSNFDARYINKYDALAASRNTNSQTLWNAN